MKREDDSLINPPLEELLEIIPHKYELVLTATKRAKQIIRQHRLNPVEESEDKHRKPLSIALADIVEGRVDKETLKVPDSFFEDDLEDDMKMFDEVEGFSLAEPSDAEGEEIEAEPDEELEEVDEVDISLDDDDDDLDLNLDLDLDE